MFPAMSWKSKSLLLGLAAALIALAVVPASGSASAAQSRAAAEDPTTLTVGVVDPTIDSFNPFTTFYSTPTMINRMMYDYLNAYTAEDATPTEGLAESWEHSEDGLTWTYQIREAEFSDGTPVTAEDVAFTYNTMMEDDSGAMANANFVGNFESVEALDDRTLQIKLSKPQATMLTLDIPIVPKHFWENVDNITKYANTEQLPTPGSGPFVLTDYQEGESITLEANENYWRGAPGFDRIIFRVYKDEDAIVEALKKGEVSFYSGLTPLQADALANEDNIVVHEAVGKRFAGLTVNPGAEAQNGQPIGDGHPALQDQRVRTAILHAIDRSVIEERVYGGRFEADGTYLPSRFENYHWEPSEDEIIGYDPAEANRILDQAGYEMGDDGVRVTPQGRPLEFRQYYHADDPEYRKIAQLMVEWLEDIGIKVNSEASDDIGGYLDSGEYDLLFTGWTVNPDPDYIFSIQLCRNLPKKPGASYQNDSYFCNQRYEQLYDDQLTAIDPAEREEIAKEMQKILYETGVVIIFGYPDMLEAYRTDVVEEGSFQLQPAEVGNIYGQDGYWSWWSAQPAGASSDSGSGDSGGVSGSSDEGGLSGVGMGVGLGALAVILLGAVLLMRRRAATAEERE